MSLLMEQNESQEVVPDVNSDIHDPVSENAENLLPEKPADDKRFRKLLIESIQTLVLALILYFAIDSVIARVQVENISMLPTLHEGEFIMVNRLAYKNGNYQRGDIVIFHNPINPREDFIKRLIGIPGDQIDIQNGQVSVNGVVLKEDYIAESVNYQGQWKVPDGYLFVLGDNRNQSYDSHSWGYLPQENIMGKAIVIYWPPKDMQIIQHIPIGLAEVTP
ncbi:MAG: signal peptidase I [Anaerolineaceae bacterium]